MVLDRNLLAAGMYARILPTCEGLGTIEPEARIALYNQITDLCFEAADAFIARSANLPVKA